MHSRIFAHNHHVGHIPKKFSVYLEQLLTDPNITID